MSDRIVILGAGARSIGEAVGEYLKLTLPDNATINALDGTDLDVRNAETVHDMVKAIKPTHVVYSVGINELDWISGIDTASMLDLFDINVIGFVHLLQALELQVDEETMPAPSVVAITSDAAWRPMRTSLAYCASKAALEMAVRVASRELAPNGWRVNAVAPGKVSDTHMTDYVDARVLELRGWTKELADKYEAQSSAIGRPVTKYEVATVVVDVLMSPVKSWTGAVIAINGGR